MHLRAKVFLWVGGSIAILFSVTFVLLTSVLRADFLELERKAVQENVKRAEGMVVNKEDELAVKISDWSQWDDTYRFIEDQNQAYIDSNLQDETLLYLHLNVRAFVNNDGQIIFERSITDDGVVVPFPPVLRSALASGELLVTHSDLSHVSKGIFLVPDGGVLIVVARPITSSDGKAPARGTLLFGAYIDTAIAQQLSRLTNLDLDFHPFSDGALPSDFRTAKETLSTSADASYIVAENDEMTIAGFGVMDDIYGKPALIVKAATNREVYEKGQKSIWFFTKIMLIDGAVFIFVILLLSEQLALKKLLHLNKEVEAVSRSQDMQARLSIVGSDEFSQLAVSINRMLEALGSLQSKKKESEMRFRTVADTAPVMIWMVDTERRFTYFNKGWIDFTGRSVDQELGVGWLEGLYPEDRENFENLWKESFEKQLSFRLEYRLRRADGVFRWILTTGVPNYSPDHTFLGFLGASIDITERKESDERKERYIGEVERMNKVMIERELKMMELKKKIKELEKHND